jgi:hypothetical protein
MSTISNDMKIKMVLNQTNYTQEEVLKKLEEYNNDHIKIIRNYLGIEEKKEDVKVKSINQEIYKQIRTKLDTSEYRKAHPIDIDQAITNLRESEELEQFKNKKRC